MIATARNCMLAALSKTDCGLAIQVAISFDVECDRRIAAMIQDRATADGLSQFGSERGRLTAALLAGTLSHALSAA